MRVYLAAIHHRHGISFYAGASEKELTAKLAAYCRSWWGERSVAVDLPRPADDEDTIETYFLVRDDESIEYGDDEIVAEPIRIDVMRVGEMYRP